MFADQNDMALFETSALAESEADHVESIFMTLVHKLQQSKPMHVQSDEERAQKEQRLLLKANEADRMESKGWCCWSIYGVIHAFLSFLAWVGFYWECATFVMYLIEVDLYEISSFKIFAWSFSKVICWKWLVIFIYFHQIMTRFHIHFYCLLLCSCCITLALPSPFHYGRGRNKKSCSRILRITFQQLSFNGSSFVIL